jgi:hypothetical protein
MDGYWRFAFLVIRLVFLGLGARVILPVALYKDIALLIICRSASVKGMGSTTKSTPFGSLMYPILFCFKIPFDQPLYDVWVSINREFKYFSITVGKLSPEIVFVILLVSLSISMSI